jgi:hypothetical protein
MLAIKSFPVIETFTKRLNIYNLEPNWQIKILNESNIKIYLII